MSVTSTASDYIKHEINDEDYYDPLYISGFHGLPSDKEAFAVTSQFEHQQEDFIKSNLEDIDVKLEPQSPPPEKFCIKRESLAHSDFWSSEVSSDTVAGERSLAYPGKPNLSEESNILNSDIKEETLSVTYDAGGNDLVDEEEYKFSGPSLHDNKSKNLGNVTGNAQVTDEKAKSVKNEEETNNYSPFSPRKYDNTVSSDEISHGTNNTDENSIIKKEHDLERFKTEEPLNTQQFRCNVCDFSTDYKKNLTVHLQIHALKKPYHCNVCDYKAAHKQHFIKHVRTHTGEKPFQCNVCEYTAVQKQNLIVHMRTHTGEKPFKCNVCGYRTIHKQHLISHIRSHTGEKPFRCNICNFSTAQKTYLTTHLRLHSGEKHFSCNVCEYSAVHKQNLYTHMRIHTNEIPFKCNVCDYGTVQKHHLISHMRTHSGEKLYQCNVCQYSAVHKQNLISHMRIHTGAKPFKCNVCEYSANQKQGLIKHMRIHTGEKPFRCNACDLRLTQQGSLVRHMRTHTGEKL